MKSIYGLLALAIAGIAHADTVELNRTVGFGATHEYLNVANAYGLDIDIVIGGTAGVNIEGDLFTGAYFGSGVPFVVTDSEGAQLTVVLNETSETRCTHSGRGAGACHKVYTLVSGTITE